MTAPNATCTFRAIGNCIPPKSLTKSGTSTVCKDNSYASTKTETAAASVIHGQSPSKSTRGGPECVLVSPEVAGAGTLAIVLVVHCPTQIVASGRYSPTTGPTILSSGVLQFHHEAAAPWFYSDDSSTHRYFFEAYASPAFAWPAAWAPEQVSSQPFPRRPGIPPRRCMSRSWRIPRWIVPGINVVVGRLSTRECFPVEKWPTARP